MLRSIFNTCFAKTGPYHVRKADNTNKSGKNGPISKYHIKNLQKDVISLTPRPPLGQYRQEGFSLIEVMVAAGILAALSYFGLQLTDQMRDNQRLTEKRFEAFNLANEIQTILANSDNCKTTFSDIKIKELTNWKVEPKVKLPLNSIVKKFYSAEDLEPVTREKFKTSDPDEPILYSGLKINSYWLEMRNEDFISDDSLEASLTFLIELSLKGDQLIKKRMPLSFKFDPLEPNKMTSCTSVGGNVAGSGAMEIVDPLKEPQWVGKSGEEACKEQGKSCAFVSSINYASNLYGEQGALSNLCLIGYNQNLEGVANGNPKSNIHSCQAKLGRFSTYQISEKDYGVTCQGIFLAHCH